MSDSSKHSLEIQDTLTALGHKMIRQAVGDDFDPFMVPVGRDQNLLLRSCFYYSILITPKYAVLFDNEGRGGMCKMSPDEIRAVWDIDALLSSQDLNVKDLNGSKPLPNLPVPKAIEVVYDLEDSEQIKYNNAVVSSENNFAKSILLSELIKDDIYLGLNLISKFYNPEKVLEVMNKIEQREKLNEWISNNFEVKQGKTKEISVIELKDLMNRWIAMNSGESSSPIQIQSVVDTLILKNTPFLNLEAPEVKLEVEVKELQEMFKILNTSLSVNVLEKKPVAQPAFKAV